MSGQLDDNIKRWTAKRKSTLVVEIIQGKTTVAEANLYLEISRCVRAQHDSCRTCVMPFAARQRS